MMAPTKVLLTILAMTEQILTIKVTTAKLIATILRMMVVAIMRMIATMITEYWVVESER